MKRFFVMILASALVLASFDASAQRDQRGNRSKFDREFNHAASGLGVTFGYAHSAYRVADWATDKVRKADGLDGFQLGLTKDVEMIESALFIQTGLVYTYQNDSKNNDFGGIRLIGDWNEHFLSVPLKVKYAVPLTDRIGIFVTGGPSLVFGLASKMKCRARLGDGQNAATSYNFFTGKSKVTDNMTGEMSEWISAQYPETKYRRFDAQVGGSVGIRFLEIMEAQIGYDWGLVNKYKGETLDDLRMRRQQLYISVGLRF